MLDKDFIKYTLEVHGFELGDSSNFGEQYYHSFDKSQLIVRSLETHSRET
ncbi:hypothetical protein [Vibrio apostichopi]|nr:hypothetical protein [Vibrio sp. FE10]